MLFVSVREFIESICVVKCLKQIICDYKYRIPCFWNCLGKINNEYRLIKMDFKCDLIETKKVWSLRTIEIVFEGVGVSMFLNVFYEAEIFNRFKKNVMYELQSIKRLVTKTSEKTLYVSIKFKCIVLSELTGWVSEKKR